MGQVPPARARELHHRHLDAGRGYRTHYLGKYLNNYEHDYVPPGWDQWYGWMGFYDIRRNQDDFYLINNNGQELRFDPELTHDTDLFAQQANAYIEQAAGQPEPFFMYLSLNAPHAPAPPAERYQDEFPSAIYPRSPAFNEADVSDKPDWVRAKPRLTPRQIGWIDSLHRKRLRSMLSVEDAVAGIVATLRATGQLSNTYLLFTSDNGHHSGERRQLPQKMTAYDEDIRVPLYVRGPGVPAGESRRHLVVNNDLASTIASLGDVRTPTFVDGRSFAPLLLRPDPPSVRAWRGAFVVEKWGPAITPPYRAVRSTNMLFVRYATGERELYDLRSDPWQLDAISKGPRRRRLVGRLAPRLNAIMSCEARGCRRAENVWP
ncbi:MAG: sulfatase-like hydrolase/transferase [Actinomycetota bacterium]|nr:sulfatase-like hydrolase/transferase [Actinomycetota bacterium]